MQTVTLGATGLEVTPLAYGTWQFGGDWGPVDERAAIEAIQYARSLGINFFDTAQAYGFGRSEQLLGRALADLAEIDHIMAAAVPVGGPTPEGMS
jgi:aryl-alcohol dehydrogenase-like predicted oxidoreductase